MFPTTTVGSLPKPDWLAEPEKLWAAWRLTGDELQRAKERAALEWLREQEAAGIDIVGDKILEVNVFSPGNLHTCSKLAGVRFSTPILESIERKVEIRKDPSSNLDNLALSVL